MGYLVSVFSLSKHVIFNASVTEELCQINSQPAVYVYSSDLSGWFLFRGFILFNISYTLIYVNYKKESYPSEKQVVSHEF